MSWAAQIRSHAASKQPKPRKARPVVLLTWAQTRAPNEATGDPGSVVAVHYTISDGSVRVTNDKGVPVGGLHPYVLQPGDSAPRIARMLSATTRERTPVLPSGSWLVEKLQGSWVV